MKDMTAEAPSLGAVISADGTRIAYDQYGRGDAVVLVGASMQDRAALAPLAALLADRFTVYAYDRRGRGDSGDTAPYAVEREIEDLAAVIGVAGGSACVFRKLIGREPRDHCDATRHVRDPACGPRAELPSGR